MKITIKVPNNTVRIMVCVMDENGRESEPKTITLDSFIGVIH